MLSHYYRSRVISTQQEIILRVVVPSPLWQSFDYLPNSAQTFTWQPGMRVRVPFGRREMVGVIVDVVSEPQIARDKLKTILETIDTTPIISPSLLQFYKWASEYYHHPLGEVILGTLPKLLREGRVISSDFANAMNKESQSSYPPLALNAEQQQALHAINQVTGFKAFLLAGVTGSGKTEVYLQVIAEKLQAGKQALVLVPEISLTPQTVVRFEQRFNANIAVMHSGLTDRQRMQAWLDAANARVDIVIGTRSAIFTPMPNLGVIILDEEHDSSFKQQSGFRYSARDLAVVRAHRDNIPVILGSATPSLESLHNVNRDRYQRLNLTERAGDAIPPTIKIVDLCGKDLHDGLSPELLDKMQQHLRQQGQILLFLNRRGFAPMLMCHHCGWVAQCKRCDARMTLHLQPRHLICHHCDIVKSPPRICEQCHQGELLMLGLGTERIEATLQKYFPQHNIIRIDRDSTSRKGSMQKLLDQMHSGEANILIGTQMVSKGHHFANLSLVAIVDADSGLFSTDFRATERMAQLLLQVAGRAGRSGQQGEVIIQTHHPDHPLLNTLIKQGYDAFAEMVFSERKATILPPFSHLALLRAEAVQREHALQFLQAAKSHLLQSKIPTIKMLGPIPATMERKANRYRAQLLLQSSQRGQLQQLLQPLVIALPELEQVKKVRWSLDIDPQDLY